MNPQHLHRLDQIVHLLLADRIQVEPRDRLRKPVPAAAGMKSTGNPKSSRIIARIFRTVFALSGRSGSRIAPISFTVGNRFLRILPRFGSA
jgi:hypothetical protein